MKCRTIEMDENGAVTVAAGITVCGREISIGGVGIPTDATVVSGDRLGTRR